MLVLKLLSVKAFVLQFIMYDTSRPTSTSSYEDALEVVRQFEIETLTKFLVLKRRTYG